MSYGKNLRNALSNNEFLLNYQPQYDIKQKKIIGLEALLRWNNPELGAVPPLKFIKIAEETGFIVPIGRWVIMSACKFLKDLHLKGYKRLQMAVNVSIIQLLQEGFVDFVMQTLKEYELEPDYLELEITESALIESYEVVSSVLKTLKENGVGIALDDFGKGYSSLSYLRDLPITTLKIDKSFTDGITLDKKTRTLFMSVVTMGKEIGLNIIIEGVEYKEQLEYLIDNNCDRLQGYVFSKPLSENDIEELLFLHFVKT